MAIIPVSSNLDLNTKIQKIPILPSNFHLKTESLPNFNKVNHLIKVGVTRAII